MDRIEAARVSRLNLLRFHEPMTVNEGTMVATLSRLRSECELCGAWSTFTGRTETRDGRTYTIVRCPRGDGEFSVWNRDREPLVTEYERARASVRDPEGYQRALATLTGGDGEAIAALLAAPPPELPMFSIEDVALPAAVARRWCELVLDWAGWRPAPTRSLRVEEALATALQLESRACVGFARQSARKRVVAGSAAEVLPSRFSAAAWFSGSASLRAMRRATSKRRI